MARSWTAFLAIVLFLAGPAAAQPDAPPTRFRWQPGQVLSFRVEQVTTVTDTTGGQTVETVMKLNLVKRWQVLAVGPQGDATLQLTLSTLRTELKKTDGETVVFDSAQPDPNNKEMAAYVGVPIATLRLDAAGKLLEVKESKFGPASRYEADLPFKLELPAAALAPALAWERPFSLKLEPPQGTGEVFAAVQSFTVKSIAAGRAVVGVTTALKSQPEAVAERIPLLPSLVEGELEFDLAGGRYVGARLKVDRELADHNGPGSKYRYASSYTETVSD
jgi:hypothetical protein